MSLRDDEKSAEEAEALSGGEELLDLFARPHALDHRLAIGFDHEANAKTGGIEPPSLEALVDPATRLTRLTHLTS